MMFSCIFVTFHYGVRDQVWYLIVSIPDLCLLPYFEIEVLQYSILTSLLFCDFLEPYTVKPVLCGYPKNRQKMVFKPYGTCSLMQVKSTAEWNYYTFDMSQLSAMKKGSAVAKW